MDKRLPNSTSHFGIFKMLGLFSYSNPSHIGQHSSDSVRQAFPRTRSSDARTRLRHVRLRFLPGGFEVQSVACCHTLPVLGRAAARDPNRKAHV